MKIDSKETCETVGKGIKHQLMPPGCFVKSELAVLLRKMGALNEVNGPLGKKKGKQPRPVGGSWDLELSCQCEEMQNQADV